MDFISTDKAPAAIGPYSQGICVNGMIFTSGQIPLSPDGKLVNGDISVQTTQVLSNLSAVLQEGGSSLAKVVKTTIFLANMEDFAQVNAVYASFFAEHKPARSTIAVKSLPLGASIEIEAIALV